MFNFKEELAKYRESLEVSDLSGGVSGDEVRDILDIAKELVNARGNKLSAENEKPEQAVSGGKAEQAVNAGKPEKGQSASAAGTGKPEPEPAAAEGSEGAKAKEEKAK